MSHNFVNVQTALFPLTLGFSRGEEIHKLYESLKGIETFDPLKSAVNSLSRDAAPEFVPRIQLTSADEKSRIIISFDKIDLVASGSNYAEATKEMSHWVEVLKKNTSGASFRRVGFIVRSGHAFDRQRKQETLSLIFSTKIVSDLDSTDLALVYRDTIDVGSAPVDINKRFEFGFAESNGFDLSMTTDFNTHQDSELGANWELVEDILEKLQRISRPSDSWSKFGLAD